MLGVNGEVVVFFESFKNMPNQRFVERLPAEHSEGISLG